MCLVIGLNQTAAVRANPGPVFEQWMGVEHWKRLKYLGSGKLHYLRPKTGAEVDFIIEREGKLTPLEAKWTGHPSLTDARHLLTFPGEHPKQAKCGYLVCRCQAPLIKMDAVVKARGKDVSNHSRRREEAQTP